MLAEVFESLRTSTARKDRVSLWLYVDDDDDVTRAAIEKGAFPDPGFPVHWHIGPRTPDWGQTHQVLWNATGRTAEVYMIANDDVRFETQGWDDVVRASFAEYPDGVVLACPHDPVTPYIGTFPIVGWGWLNGLGRVYPGYFHYWFDDKWADQIGRMIGRYTYIPMLLSPIRGKGRTQRMRCLPFWTRFFELTLFERKECARKLIAIMYPQDGDERAAALTRMETMATSFAKEQETFSDLYCAFQEERHSALDPEVRNLFYPLYLRQEVVAVIRLLSVAQELIANKQYAVAIDYIEATQMADLRVRAAHDMKIACLRALGRNAEAEALTREAMLAWPEWNTARRLFRFFGRLATDGKRWLVSFISRPSAAKKRT
jgi:hypothetical protein